MHALSGAALAPMCVHPDRQRDGIGSALVRRGLEISRQRGVPFVVVLGHPDYYPRFGFSAELAKPLHSRYPAGAAWMAIDLQAGVLHGVEGFVRYPDAFQRITG